MSKMSLTRCLELQPMFFHVLNYKLIFCLVKSSLINNVYNSFQGFSCFQAGLEDENFKCEQEPGMKKQTL